jgi:hypothetical protein
MATIRRTTTTLKTPQRTLPSLNQPNRGGRAPEGPTTLPELPPDESPPDNEWPDVPVDPEIEAEAAENVVIPVGVEQLERSREMQAMGIANWVAAHDERTPEELESHAVQGVGPLER